MSRPAAGQAPSVQQSSQAVQQSSEADSTWEEILQEFQERYKEASRMHCFRYHVRRKHQRKPYVQVYGDNGYVRWVRAHVQEEGDTREQLRLLHYIRLR